MMKKNTLKTLTYIHCIFLYHSLRKSLLLVYFSHASEAGSASSVVIDCNVSVTPGGEQLELQAA